MVRVMMIVGALLVLVPSAFAGDSKDAILRVLQRDLAGVRIAEPPSSVGTRSAMGPHLYRRVVDSVVLIVTEGGSLGSGVVVSPKGHVLTNWHVVQGQGAVGVVGRNPELLKGIDRVRPEHIFPAEVLATDARRDLALVLMQGLSGDVRFVPLAQAGAVEVGQDVYAIGHPKNFLWSYAEGVVSQIRPDYEWTVERNKYQATVIQTQTPLHPGNSGGALFDGSGKVVGINAWRDAAEASLSFAIAVSEVQGWIESLKKR